MTWLEGSRDLVELLDRHFAAFAATDDRQRLYRIGSLLSLLRLDARLAAICSDLEAEAEERAVSLREHERQVLGALWRLCTDHADLLRAGRDEVRREEGGADGDTWDAFLDSLLRPPRFALAGWRTQPDDPTVISGVLTRMMLWNDSANRDGTRAAEQDATRASLNRVRQLHRHAIRKHRIALRSHAGLALLRLRALERATNPSPIDLVTGAESGVVEALLAEEDVAGPLHDPSYIGHPGVDRLDVASAAARRDAELLHGELRLRVGLVRSRLALVRRFAARCEAYDAEELRRASVRNTREAEKQLTLRLARFLFDSGLTPFVDPTYAELRPDVFDPGGPAPCYVEAKQYGSAAPAALVRKAVRQVWSTWGRLRNSWPLDEAFLVVFRRSGPRVELPPVLNHKGYKMYPLLVDIAPPSNTGSRERHKPVSLSEEELLPSDGAEPAGAGARRRQRRRRPDAPRSAR